MPPPATRRLRAHLRRARAIRSGEEIGVHLDFAPLRAHLCGERIEQFADLNAEHSVASVRGLGLVLRILRAARIAAPELPEALVGEPEAAAELLERTTGTQLALELRARSRVRFVAWTDGADELDAADAANGRVVIDDAREVHEAPDAWWIVRAEGQLPVRVPRSSVVRQRTELDRWFEVLHVERP